MASEAARGKKALDARDYEKAIKEYTAAIKASPTSPDFFIQRSTAHQRAGKLEQALADAEQAILNGQRRAKKEAIVEGQFRRAIALYKLGRLGDAQYLLTLVKQRDEKHKQCDIWINKVKYDLEQLPGDDDKRKRTVSETPNQPNTEVALAGNGATKDATSTNGTAAATLPATPMPTPADKIRYEWYQSSENIYFTLLAKGVPKEKAEVDITEHSLNISFPIDAASSYNLSIEPLFASVQPEKCITRVLPSKVEIILVKATPDQKWSALESSQSQPVRNNSVSQVEMGDAKKSASAVEPQKGPAYPTSSKSGPKDWDKVAKELKVSEKPGSLEDDDDFEGGDEANHFFKKLFKGASPDMQRAMMKSYTESNGTALSTNWNEVSKGTVETTPPDGMEAKKWS